EALEVFPGGDAEGQLDLLVPGFRDETDRIGLGVDELLQAGIVGYAAAGAPGHAEGDEAGVLRALLGEELGIDHVGAGIAALDIVEPQPVEQPRNGDLVLKRELDARGLGAVAERGVEEVEAFFGHGSIVVVALERNPASL